MIFKGKHIINGKIVLKSGTHIGGTDEGFDIGGIDSIVIKNPKTSQPIIPGSSLKGKMRSLLEWQYNLIDIKTKNGVTTGKGKSKVNEEDETFHPIAILFGATDSKEAKTGKLGPVRIIFRDCSLNNKSKEELENYLGEGIYSEVKTENGIDRISSNANPRKIERVVAGAEFDFEIVVDNYLDDDYKNLKFIFEGMRLLQDSFIGGGGSRGNGEIEFKDIKVAKRYKEYYSNNKKDDVVDVDLNSVEIDKLKF